jgi:hypothetical protein
MESPLATSEDLKRLTSIGNNVDCELLIPHILLAQQLYVEPVLGCALYDDVISKYDSNTLTGDYLTLWESYIVPALAYSAWFSSSPFLHIRTSRNGLNKSGTDTLEPVEIQEFSMYLSKVENFKAFYLDRLEHYLKCNKTLFPLYRSNDVSQSNGGSIYLGYRTNPLKGRYWDNHSYNDSTLDSDDCGNCDDC